MTIPPLLAMTLDLGVPLEIARLREATPDQILHQRIQIAERLARADASIEMLSARTGETAAALIKALALLAYAEGGVTAFGRHWCTDHQACIEAGTA